MKKTEIELKNNYRGKPNSILKGYVYNKNYSIGKLGSYWMLINTNVHVQQVSFKTIKQVVSYADEAEKLGILEKLNHQAVTNTPLDREEIRIIIKHHNRLKEIYRD